MRPDNDNNPSSNPQNQPDQTLSQSKELTLQPIHSEDEIRKELAENGPSYDTTNPDGSDETTPDGEDAIGDNPSSTLRTEPIKPLTYANPATNNYSTRAKAEPRKKGITIKSVVGLVIILVIAGLLWYLLFSEKVRTSDLVEESVGNTTHLRPQQWKKTEVMENSFETPDIEEGNLET